MPTKPKCKHCGKPPSIQGLSKAIRAAFAVARSLRANVVAGYWAEFAVASAEEGLCARCAVEKLNDDVDTLPEFKRQMKAAMLAALP